MTDRPREPLYVLDHIVVPGDPLTERFQRRGGGGGEENRYRILNRGAHAANLRAQLEETVDAARQLKQSWIDDLKSRGMVLRVEGWPEGFELAIESLDLRRSGIELLTVVRESAEPDRPEVATVYVPDDKLHIFFGRLEQYATEVTGRGRPRHERLVANIRFLQLATLDQLWTDYAPFPQDDRLRWWEVWLRRTGDELATLDQIAQRERWSIVETPLEFPGRTVTAVRATASSLGRALGSRLPIAEVREARLAQSPANLDLDTQQAWVEDLAQRIEPAADDAPAVCLLDTGVYRHSLFHGALNGADLHHVVGPDGVDRNGHGTEMSGLALFGDLTEALTGVDRLGLNHRLESVKVLPDIGQNARDMYGTVTASGTAMPEAVAPHRRRVFLLANSDHNSPTDGRPTLWSATVDALSFGTDVTRVDGGLELLSDPDPTSSRLFILAAGNVRDRLRVQYLDDCDTSPVEDPGQAFNAITVGAFTSMDKVPANPDFAGYRPLAPEGDLSPYSRTSLTFSGVWPIKPDIVLEGGNALVSPDETFIGSHDAVMLTTTSRREPEGRPLGSTNATSAAAAQAARLAAMASSRYPNLWPETLRGLLVHSAEWTERMRATIDAVPTKVGKLGLVRRYGFGVPTLERVLRSASSAVSLVTQAEILPFDQEENRNAAKLREMHLYDLPWPREQLLDLDDTEVRMRVTLSYFIEPNPSSRGWRGRYVYPSHGLRFDIRRPGETTREFRLRLNRAAETEEGNTQRGTAPAPDWTLGPKQRDRGSLHADLWRGTAAELADSGVLGVYPVGGWWKNNNKQDRNQIPVRYGLLVSLFTPETQVDLYTSIAAQVGIAVEVAT